MEYKNQNGHCRVPSSTPLGRWVSDQRTYKKDYDRHNNNLNLNNNRDGDADSDGIKRNGDKAITTKKSNNCRMTPTRIESLSKVDFCWNMDDYKWEQVCGILHL